MVGMAGLKVDKTVEILAVFTGFGGARGVRIRTVGYDRNGKEKDFYCFVPVEWLEDETGTSRAERSAL